VKTPVVLLHGSFGRGEDWREVLQLLGGDAQTPDLPAHGERFAQAAASFEDTVDAIVRELPDRCDLVGYSLGGRLALAAAMRAPAGRVRSLVLESAHTGLGADARAERRRQDADRGEQISRSPRAFLKDFYAAELFASFRAHPDFGRIFVERAERAERAPAALGATFAALSVGNQPPLTDALLRSDIPTMLTVGSLDTKYSNLARELHSAAPPGRRIQLHVVPGVGHNVHLEAPAAFAAALIAFWEERS
jgi:2-succinyl-6-hydroxy-2,4-cyclohexadiene-1-carboxylate synthase